MSSTSSPPVSRSRWLGAFAAAQVAVLLGLAALAYATASQGQVLLLRVRPINLAAVAAGEQVEVHYDISDLPLALWRGPAPAPRVGERVFVRLVPAASGAPAAVWQAAAVYDQAPAAAADGAVLPATVEGTWQKQLHLRYFGLERLTVPSAGAARFKQIARDSAGVHVRVAVAPWGTVRLLGTE